jgi:hypothetical protein
MTIAPGIFETPLMLSLPLKVIYRYFLATKKTTYLLRLGII